ncbi:tyrosine-type recombinase/integrase [Paraburkholderia sabiae]|uniref:Site-specific integrase n=1 Tax=Paraburkholderia sabiae TaxID=273251 RepID=A0ABU9QJ94_9BURK|nr:site-specific integrase [Paraburkholderia sabiae]WJZ79773.1 site-specific integrase [Paraburkholderia sabiae]CAD6559298.1 Tyrosine recombinase XerC [Paraburkholderia sabiae]
MRLFFTDSQFVVAGHPRPGVPFLCDGEMELVDAPNRYLRYLSTIKGRTRAENTWRTYGAALYEFFAFLEASGLAWDRANQSQIAAWRDGMLERGCARSTVNQRLRTVDVFYVWSKSNGMTHSVPFDRTDVWVAKPHGFLAHVDGSGSRFDANALTVQTHKAVPKFLHLNQAIRFLDALTPYRLRLMGYLALLTGMRREEVVGLNYRVLPNPAGRDPQKQVPMRLDPSLTPTKGAKERIVMLPYDLAIALYEYFTFGWPKLSVKYRAKFGEEPTLLFLAESGDPLSVNGLNNAFRRVSQKSGIWCTPHMLRHTFGTYELIRMGREKTPSQALLWVRDRMGHSSITTTEIYVHAADLVAHDDVDGYHLDICRALAHGNPSSKNRS